MSALNQLTQIFEMTQGPAPKLFNLALEYAIRRTGIADTNLLLNKTFAYANRTLKDAEETNKTGS